jgi:hypothetical protein
MCDLVPRVGKSHVPVLEAERVAVRVDAERRSDEREMAARERR